MALHVGDTIRFPFLAKKDGVAWDVSAATTLTLYVLKPGGTKLTETLTFTTDGTDGYVEWSSTISDMTTAQKYRFQSYIICGGFTLHSDYVDVTLEGNIA